MVSSVYLYVWSLGWHSSPSTVYNELSSILSQTQINYEQCSSVREMWVFLFFFLLCKQWLGGLNLYLNFKCFLFVLLATYRKQEPKWITLARMCYGLPPIKLVEYHCETCDIMGDSRQPPLKGGFTFRLKRTNNFVWLVCLRTTHGEHFNTPFNGHALNLHSVCNGLGGSHRRSEPYGHIYHQIWPSQRFDRMNLRALIPYGNGFDIRKKQSKSKSMLVGD